MSGHREVRMYLPIGRMTQAVIDRGSAVVSFGDKQVSSGDEQMEYMLVFYGEPRGAANMATFADRAMVAYYHMHDGYPTSAKMPAPVDEVVQIGTLDPNTGRVHLGELADDILDELEAWLSIEGERSAKLQQLQNELRVTPGMWQVPPSE